MFLVEKKEYLGYNLTAMDEIVRIHDMLFKKVFSIKKNMQAFLRNCLPPELSKIINYSSLKIDSMSYISPQFKEGFSDVIARTRIKTKNRGICPLDLYILVEHKSYLEVAIFIQLLRYMLAMWQEDIDNKHPLRLILPVVFYHGKPKWTLPLSFVDQFDVDDELKKYLLDFQYILFDTAGIDIWDELNREMKQNVPFFSSIALMKSVQKKDEENIIRLFRLWSETGFKTINPFIEYIVQTRKIEREKLKTMLEESKIDGGAIMETLYKEIEREGMQKGMQKVARNAFEKGLPDDTIADLTGFSMREIKKIKNAWLSTKKSKTTH